ncbi:MAG: hypothetical protein AAF485_18755, partial [Chloroflexota bacterium]
MKRYQIQLPSNKSLGLKTICFLAIFLLSPSLAFAQDPEWENSPWIAPEQPTEVFFSLIIL